LEPEALKPVALKLWKVRSMNLLRYLALVLLFQRSTKVCYTALGSGMLVLQVDVLVLVLVVVAGGSKHVQTYKIQYKL
jgi:hypothetical protein